MPKLVSPLCRIGRKKPIQDKVIRLSPNDIKIYVEPFVGSGDIFFAMGLDPEKVKSYINDKDSDIANAFKIMKSNPNISNIAKFKDMSLEQVRSFVKGSHSGLDKLAQIIYKLCGTFGSKGGDNKIYKNPNIEPKLRKMPLYAEYLKNTNISNTDYKSLFSHDSPNTFFYLDPPYEKSKGLYKDAVIDYKQMADRLKKLKGKFLLSINDSAEVRETFKDFKIMGLAVKGGGQTNTDIGVKIRKELFIKNY
jgi:DNA adenine methylase